MFTWSKEKAQGFQPWEWPSVKQRVCSWLVTQHTEVSEVPSDFKKEKKSLQRAGCFWTSPWNRMPAFILMSCRPCHSDAKCQLWEWGAGRGNNEGGRHAQVFLCELSAGIDIHLRQNCLPLPYPTPTSARRPAPLLPEASNSGGMGLGEIQVSGFGADSLWFCASLNYVVKFPILFMIMFIFSLIALCWVLIYIQEGWRDWAWFGKTLTHS